jgi:MraZ protein
MFIGEYQHTIDDKGRIAFPVKFRKALTKGAVVTRGIDTCLSIYTLEEWQKLATQVAALPMSQANARAFSRLMLSGAMDMVPDAQGRITVPEYLRQYAAMDKEVVLVGLYNRLELWSKTNWERYKAETERQSEALAEKMGELGV